MTFQQADSFSVISFLILAAIMLAIIGFAAYKAQVSNRLISIFFLVVFALTQLASSGIIRDNILPAVPLIFAFLLLSAIYLALTDTGERVAQRFSFSALIAFQVFRLPLELILHHWAEIGTIPNTMTWSGQNFDIATGIASLLIAPFANRSRAAVWIFQLIGFALLLNVLRVAVLSSPLPFSWQLANPLQLVLYSPYILIAPLFVWPAFLGHLILFRKLRLSS